MSERPHVNRPLIAAIALCISLVCAGVLVMGIRDRWHQPEIKSAEQAQTTTTGRAARSVGATVSETDPKLAVEPTPAGPKQAQPANPN
ncbi:MAG: hypothetical protein JOY90_09875 [Bradyrhizobium sp.]|uniref:hypothetical protein n=1 Tax=Bradyrhizobium sp. TaxID=376 RepID=UPI001DDF575D|nr:hypothetical protein [Bradyrhizobium sp.]MBV9560748.1 hypothetical protein [Bradyrhizobium sp.]